MTTNLGLWLAERRIVPDTLVRWGIRRLLAERLRDRATADSDAAWAARLRTMPVALVPDKANEQHYEVPAPFFARALGRRLKYSGAYWPDGVATLDAAEEAMLELYAERAELRDGQRVLDLGCGWGSLSLWAAHRFPESRFLAVSNSAVQRAWIEARAPENVEVVTADVNGFDTDRRFDRVVSIEMFEHMRNYAELMRRIAGWLEPGGKLFVHIFCNRDFTYEFETDGAANWMGRHFFTGGLMPGWDLLPQFDDDLELESRWKVDGTHYARTAEAWLSNTDRHRDEILGILAGAYGEDDAQVWLHRWRIFFLACAELFAWDDGKEWLVGHYRFTRR